MNSFVVISGCSGGGKTTLIAELARRGFAVVEEPGRRIVRQELHGDGAALPWVNPVAFAERAIETSLGDRVEASDQKGWVFFDRGLIDASAALEHLTGESVLGSLRKSHRYNSLAFLTPPWPEIFVADDERRHGFDEAVKEYRRLLGVYPSLGYDIAILPRIGVSARADYVINELDRQQAGI